MKANKNIYSLAIFSFFFLLKIDAIWGQFNSHVFLQPAKKNKFSDEVLIKSTVHKFEQSIKTSDSNLFDRIITNDFTDSTGIINSKSKAKQKYKELVKDFDISIRSDYSKRRTPKLAYENPNWDFELDIKKIKFFNKKEYAVVHCIIYFVFDQPDDIIGLYYSKGPKKINEKITLREESGKWKIEKVNKFFEFVSKRKEKFLSQKNNSIRL